MIPFPGSGRAAKPRGDGSLFTKLLGLADSMQTPTGRRLATERTEFMKGYLRQLARELGLAAEQVESAIVRCRRPPSGDRQ